MFLAITALFILITTFSLCGNDYCSEDMARYCYVVASIFQNTCNEFIVGHKTLKQENYIIMLLLA